MFHELGNPEDPCTYCPRGRCKVGECGCEKYVGASLSQSPHEYHSSGVQWGSWGKVQFLGAEDVGGSNWLTQKPQQKREPAK